MVSSTRPGRRVTILISFSGINRGLYVAMEFTGAIADAIPLMEYRATKD